MKIICIFIMFYTVRLWLWDKQKVCKNVQSKINGQNNPPPPKQINPWTSKYLQLKKHPITSSQCISEAAGLRHSLEN